MATEVVVVVDVEVDVVDVVGDGLFDLATLFN